MTSQMAPDGTSVFTAIIQIVCIEQYRSFLKIIKYFIDNYICTREVYILDVHISNRKIFEKQVYCDFKFALDDKLAHAHQNLTVLSLPCFCCDSRFTFLTKISLKHRETSYHNV